MKITSKRLLSILLCLAMVLAVLPVAAMAEGTTRLYCAAPSTWSNCNVYWWGSADTNPGWPGKAMIKGADGLWYYDIPSDATNVIFNNGSGSQSADLTMPTDDKVQWNYDAKEWVTYGSEVEEVETVYYLRGSMNGWAADDASKMTKQDDGTYAITLALEAGTYEYKAAVADWSWSCPGGDNAILTLDEATDVTFVLDVANNTLTNDAPVVEPEPVAYTYYVAGDEGLTGYEWDPAQNEMIAIDSDNYYIIFNVTVPGTFEYKITTGSWETPSYGPADGGNYSVNVKNPSYVYIYFNAETTEVTCDIEEWGASELKFQLNADASADDETVDLRLITYVDSLDYSIVRFQVEINGEVAIANCEVVYEAINVNGTSLTCEDIFGVDGYLVTYTVTDIPAEYYGVDISAVAEFHPLDADAAPWATNTRTIVLSDILG